MSFSFLFLNFNFYFILLYNTVLVLPYIDMNPPRVYMWSQTWTPLPPLSPQHPSASSPCTSPIIGYQNAKVGSQETPGVTGNFGLGVQNEAGKRLIDFCQENALDITDTLFQQHKRRLYTWTSPGSQQLKSDWLYSLKRKMEKLYTVSKNKTWSWLWLRSWTTYCQIQT